MWHTTFPRTSMKKSPSSDWHGNSASLTPTCKTPFAVYMECRWSVLSGPKRCRMPPRSWSIRPRALTRSPKPLDTKTKASFLRHLKKSWATLPMYIVRNMQKSKSYNHANRNTSFWESSCFLLGRITTEMEQISFLEWKLLLVWKQCI